MSGVGKQVGDEWYLHRSALGAVADTARLDAIHGALAALPGDAEAAINVVKFNVRSGRVSLMEYGDFDDDPFPTLISSWTQARNGSGFTRRSYTDSLNPPILHRKELLVQEAHPGRAAWCALSSEAEALGLFDDTRVIGFRMNWERLIAAKGYALEGAQLVPIANQGSSDGNASEEAGESIYRHRTALSRSAISAPVQLLLRHCLLTRECSFFDYGCGRGDDVAALAIEGFTATGWDRRGVWCLVGTNGERTWPRCCPKAGIVRVVGGPGPRDRQDAPPPSAPMDALPSLPGLCPKNAYELRTGAMIRRPK